MIGWASRNPNDVTPGGMAMSDVQARTEIRDGMKITWHQGIVMDDGLRLDADVFAPIADGRYAVITPARGSSGVTSRSGRWRARSGRGATSIRRPWR
jgi:predicted acyl esterase